MEARPEVAQAFLLHPFMSPAMAKFDEWWDQHEDLEAIMFSLWPDESSQTAWAHRLDELFPPDPIMDYLKSSWGGHGLKRLRPYHWAWTKSAGNKGPVNREAFKNLLQSVMVKGLCTDHTQPGVELPLITQPRPELNHATAGSHPCVSEDLKSHGVKNPKPEALNPKTYTQNPKP